MEQDEFNIIIYMHVYKFGGYLYKLKQDYKSSIQIWMVTL